MRLKHTELSRSTALSVAVVIAFSAAPVKSYANRPDQAAVKVQERPMSSSTLQIRKKLLDSYISAMPMVHGLKYRAVSAAD